MTTQNLPRTQQELQCFLEEALSFSEWGDHLLRFDFFYENSKSSRLPHRWHLSLLTTRDEKQCLLDSRGELLGQYDTITPLFCLPRNPKLDATLEDLQDQLLCLRNKTRQEDLLALTQTLRTLCSPFRSVSAAYLVEDQGLFGILDPLGKPVVPVKYRKIEPFPFRERFGSGNCPVPEGLYGETGLYICRGDLHHLNTTDVYDLQGNLIFRDIADLYPREEVWVTPPRNPEDLDTFLSKEKRLRSLWVSRQEATHPFPDAPELQSIQEQAEHYSVGSLAREQNHPVWVWDVKGVLADKTARKSPEILREILRPLATGLSCQIQTEPNAILDRLGDYRDFYRQRTQVSTQQFGPELPLHSLGLTSQAYNCLVRNGVSTLGDLLTLSPTRLTNLWRATPEATREITELYQKLQKS